MGAAITAAGSGRWVVRKTEIRSTKNNKHEDLTLLVSPEKKPEVLEAPPAECSGAANDPFKDEFTYHPNIVNVCI
jgi:hypothetical protein